jgi:hypothetical protein
MAFFTRLLLAVLGMAFAALLTLGLLCWLVLYVAFASMRWLVTGQKPQVLMMWQQVQNLRKGMQSPQGARWSGGSRANNGQWHEARGHSQRTDKNTDVVEDVEVREVHERRQLPKD